MTTKVLMDVQEYLRTSFEDADCEYLDGDVVERNMGEVLHSGVQHVLERLLGRVARKLGLRILPEIRIQIHSRRYRVADIAVWRAGDDIGQKIPKKPPFLAIEILSPQDRIVRMQAKIEEYLSIGVQWVWLLDPEEKKAIYYSRKNPGGSPCEVLKTEDPAVEIPLSKVWAALEGM